MTTRFRKHIRLSSYDYTANGYYFITTCTSRRHGRCLQYSKIIEQELRKLEKHNGVSIDYYTLMPDHLHFIIVLQDTQITLSRLIQELKSRTTISIKKIGFKDKRFWQPNYYEHIIRNDAALAKIREYIKNNPLDEALDWDKIYGKIKTGEASFAATKKQIIMPL
jgi:REP element-mobilizing transposase RayT